MELLTGPLSGPLDDEGRLLHEDDAAAQLALAVARLEVALQRDGRRPTDLTGLRVLTTDRAVLATVLDVLVERLDATGARPGIAIDEVEHLGVPGCSSLSSRRSPPPLDPLSPLSLRSTTSGRTPKEAP